MALKKFRENKVLIEGHLSRLFFTRRRYFCKVISRTNHAVFLLLNNVKLVTLVRGIEVECSPCTAVFPGKIPDFFHKENNFLITGGSCIAGKKTLVLKPLIRKNCTIKNIFWKKINNKNLALVENWIKNKDTEGISELFRGIKTLFSGHVKPYFKKLKNAWNKNKPEDFFKYLCEPVGCGPGLTPSWDDFICGVIAALNILLRSKKIGEHWRIPVRKILREAAKRTTKLARYYIFFALMGYCSRWQYDLLKKISSKRQLQIKKLDKINYGHTSGIDYMHGLFFMLNLYLKRKFNAG